MSESIEEIRRFYNTAPLVEWERLEQHPVEFAINCSYLDRYIRPGDRVLDCGGGPGRYSLYLARKGCDVTLVDLSEGNIAFAKRKFAEEGVAVKAIAGDARFVDQLAPDEYDHILLMGPLYHLLEEQDRVCAVKACLHMLKPGGVLFAAFISMYAGLIYDLRESMDMFSQDVPEFLQGLENNTDYAGPAFTQAYFARLGDVNPFFERFGLQKLHLAGSESVLAPFEQQFMRQTPETQAFCIEFAKKLCEREELLSYTEHLLYVGRKGSGVGSV